MHNYRFNIAWSNEDQVYFATCPAFPGLSAFGDSPSEALAEAQIALGAFIEIYEEEGRLLPTPQVIVEYSGQTRLRMPKSLHARLARTAENEGVSLNSLIVSFLAEKVGEVGIISEVKNELMGIYEELHYRIYELADHTKYEVRGSGSDFDISKDQLYSTSAPRSLSEFVN